MGAVYFYHLTRSAPEAALRQLLPKALGAGWRVVVRGPDPARLDALDGALWTGEGFLPHGRAGGPHDDLQPVLLTTDAALPDWADCLVSVDGAVVAPAEPGPLQRVMILFDGGDGAAVQDARGQWTALTAAGHPAKYWSEDSGRWQMKAEHPRPC